MQPPRTRQWSLAVCIASCLEADFAGAEYRIQKALNGAHRPLAAYDIRQAEFDAAVRRLVLNRAGP